MQTILSSAYYDHERFIMSSFFFQLRKERERLQAMMEQLHMRQEDTPNGPVVKVDMVSW